MQPNNFDPTSIGATPMAASGAFDPTSIGATPIANQTQQGQGFWDTAGKVVGGAENLLLNNPVSHGLLSLAALPMQGFAKLMGQPDPYGGANALPLLGGNKVNITSSDQPLGKFAEEEGGNALTTALTLAPFIGPAAGPLSAMAGIPGWGGVGARVGTNIALGAGQGLAGGMQQGQNSDQLKGSAGIGAATGGILSAFGEALRGLAGNATPESRLTDQMKDKTSLTRSFNNQSTATTNPIQTMSENNLIKDLHVNNGKIDIGNLVNPQGTGSLDNMIMQQQDAGTQAVSTMQGGVSTDTFKNQVVNALKNNPTVKATGKVTQNVNEIERMFEDYKQSYGETIPYKHVDQIRIGMNKVWNPATWDVEKTIGNTARSILYDGSGSGNALKSAMQNERELINAKEFVNKLAGTAIQGGKLGKYIANLGASIAGTVAGSAFGPLGSGVAGGASMAASNAVMNHLQGNYFNPIGSGLSRFITSPTTQAVGNMGQSLLIPSLVQK